RRSSDLLMNKPASDHEPLPPDVRYVAPVMTLPSIASPDSCSPRTVCPMIRIPSSSPTVALPRSTDEITSWFSSTGFQTTPLWRYCSTTFHEPSSFVTQSRPSVVPSSTTRLSQYPGVVDEPLVRRKYQYSKFDGNVNVTFSREVPATL